MYRELKNIIDFYLRNLIKVSRKNFVEKNPDLIERNEKENLYTEDILGQYFQKIEKDEIRVLDIGTKNWFYAKGEHNFFSKLYKNFSIDGIEIDAYRLYSNFYNRMEVAKFYTKNLNNMNYIAGNLLNLKGKYDYIIWFLPFVLKNPHKLWGLPMKYFCPEKMLSHSYDLLNQNGQMLIINQGEKEAHAQEELFRKLGIEYKKLDEISSNHFAYINKRFGFIVNKK